MPRLPEAELDERLRRVRVLMCDVDGVLTDGRIWVHADGSFATPFHVRDGLGMVRLLKAGIQIVWITGRGGAPIRHRATELGITALFENVDDKLVCAQEWLAKRRMTLEHVVYVGDDEPDLAVLKAAAVGAIPSDAHSAMHAHADWVLSAPGGGGAIRSVADRLLALQSV